MDLSQSEKPENSNASWIKLVDTSDSDDECNFGLSRDMD